MQKDDSLRAAEYAGRYLEEAKIRMKPLVVDE